MREAARTQLLALDADTLRLFTTAFVPALLDVLAIDSSRLETEVQSTWSSALSALHDVLAEDAQSEFEYRGTLRVLVRESQAWRVLCGALTLTHLALYKDATVRPPSACLRSAHAAAVQEAQRPLRARCGA